MHRCWYIWGQGKEQYFEENGVYCHVCSVYQFGDKGKEVDGLMSYLSTKPIRVRYSGDIAGLTYADYLQGVASPGSADMISQSIQQITDIDKINTSEKYATIFVYASGTDAIQNVMKGNRAGMIVVGSLAGAIGVIGFGVISGPAGWVALTIGALGGTTVLAAFNVKEPKTLQSVTFTQYNTTTLEDLGCEYLNVNAQSNKENSFDK
jgi:hypothetical protein